ncbi:MAG: hypothetical protein AAFW73_09355 [Bacteroidota bacterium]
MIRLFLILSWCFFLCLSLGCEGCEQSAIGEECPDEPYGDFFIVLDRIEVLGFVCPYQDFPDEDIWRDKDNWSGTIDDLDKYYVKIRVDGFCDNIGKTEPFPIVRNGVDDIGVEAVVLNGRKGFRVNDVPIDRQLTLTINFRESCHDAACNFCINETGKPDHRVKFTAIGTQNNVDNLDVFAVRLFSDSEDCKC